MRYTMQYTYATLIVLMWALVACVPTTTTVIDDDDEPIPTREGVIEGGEDSITGDPGSGFGLDDENLVEGFVAELNGTQAVTVAGEGTLTCENGVPVIRASIDDFPQVAIILTSGATPGNYTLQDNPGDGSAASATVFLEDGRAFANEVEGLAVINDLATETGQPVIGSFDFSASSGTETISARGEFNFSADADSTFCS
ncbi:MAG: hypothetical protein ACFE0Q_09090 [Anaerolineae bacterium]